MASWYLFYSIFLAILACLFFHMNFSFILSNSIENLFGIFIGNKKSQHIYDVTSSYPRIEEIFPCVQVYLVFFRNMHILFYLFWLLYQLSLYFITHCHLAVGLNFLDILILISISLSTVLPYSIYISVINAILYSSHLLFMVDFIKRTPVKEPY